MKKSSRIKSFLAGKLNTLYFFYTYLGNKIFILLVVNFLMVVLDSIGLTLFVPLLHVGEGQGYDSDEKLMVWVYKIFNLFGAELTVFNMLILIAAIFIIKAVFVYYALIYNKITIRQMSRDIRIELSEGVKNLSFKEFSVTDVGRLQNSLLGETQEVANACSQYLDAIKSGVIVFVYLLFAFILDWQFSVLIVVGGVLTNIIYKRFYRRTKDLSRKITRNNHIFGGLVVEVVTHFKYLKATGRIEKFVGNMIKEIRNITDRHIEVGKLNAKLSAVREPMLVGIICIVISVHVMVFEASLSSVMIVLVLYYRALSYLISLQTSWNGFLAGTGSLENIRNFKQYLIEHQELPSEGLALNEINKFTLNGVRLQYADFKVLDNISLEIHKNESVAFVGESGSGKTTLINVLSGLIRATSGSVQINGRPIEECDTYAFKSRIGYVSQEATVFNADFFDNISFWDERTEENLAKFWKVADMCSIKSFIEGLPNKESELLGNNGLNISGGQKQRVSIARELYRDIDVLILDEATAALDSETERVIKESIESLQGKLTIITIAHRLSTIMFSDRIYLMEKGKVVAEGNFAELKAKSEYFSKISQLQGL